MNRHHGLQEGQLEQQVSVGELAHGLEELQHEVLSIELQDGKRRAEVAAGYKAKGLSMDSGVLEFPALTDCRTDVPCFHTERPLHYQTDRVSVA